MKKSVVKAGASCCGLNRCNKTNQNIYQTYKLVEGVHYLQECKISVFFESILMDKVYLVVVQHSIWKCTEYLYCYLTDLYDVQLKFVFLQNA